MPPLQKIMHIDTLGTEFRLLRMLGNHSITELYSQTKPQDPIQPQKGKKARYQWPHTVPDILQENVQNRKHRASETAH